MQFAVSDCRGSVVSLPVPSCRTAGYCESPSLKVTALLSGCFRCSTANCACGRHPRLLLGQVRAASDGIAAGVRVRTAPILECGNSAARFTR